MSVIQLSTFQPFSSPGRHIGYRRQDSRHPWVRVAEGASWRECWLELVGQVSDPEADLNVLEDGRDPRTLPGAITTTFSKGE